MNQPNLGQSVPDFLAWRSLLYQALGSRRSSVMDLLDSLSSNLQASTVAELSLNPLFRRDYNSLYKGIQDFLPTTNHPDYRKAVDGLFSVVSATVPEPEDRPFYLFGVDVTPWTLDKIKGNQHLPSEYPTSQKLTERAFCPNLNIWG